MIACKETSIRFCQLLLAPHEHRFGQNLHEAFHNGSHGPQGEQELLLAPRLQRAITGRLPLSREMGKKREDRE